MLNLTRLEVYNFVFKGKETINNLNLFFDGGMEEHADWYDSIF